MPNSRDTAKVIQFSNVTEFSKVSALHGEPALFATPDVESLTIDCDRCTLRDTGACDDCVVSFLLEREPEDAVVIDADEARAMRMLERAGLVPTLRFSADTQAG
jgi:hypothetical protein